MELQHGGPPLAKHIPWKVFRLKAKGVVRFHCCTRTWVNLMTHFSNGTYRCPETEECKSCLAGHPQYWAGWVLGVKEDEGVKYLFHLTDLAAYCLKEQEWRDGSLYGARIVLQRKGDRNNGPVEARIIGWDMSTPRLLMEHLEHSVRVLYKIPKGVKL
jgi:hypothetical protein